MTQTSWKPRSRRLAASTLLACATAGCSAIVGEPFEQLELANEQRPGATTVDIYAHDAGLTLTDAHRLQRELLAHNLNANVHEHVDPSAPDAIFIGRIVGADDARTVIQMVPYKIEYLFRPDYPVDEGGDSEGDLIGVGYLSNFSETQGTDQTQPVKVERADLDYLTAPSISDDEFQRRLRLITGL